MNKIKQRFTKEIEIFSNCFVADIFVFIHSMPKIDVCEVKRIGVKIHGYR